MKIKARILNKINTPENRTRIALALRQGEQSVAKACRTNSQNGPLTKAAALKAIREITGLTDEQILDADIKVNARV
jgi:hypothetical protein